MKRIGKLLLKVIIVFLIVFIAILSCYISVGYNMYKMALQEHPIDEMIESIKEKENYTYLYEVPEIYKEAVVAVEDHRFYIHKGIDYVSIFRAIVHDIINKDLIEGGSTITQQICKNIYFTQDRKLERKFAEVFMAIKLEETCDKDEILEIYINTCFYGNGCYTLKEASKLYFKREPIELTDYESTMIVGIPNAPSLYNPFNSLTLAKQRQKQVLNAMVTYGNLTEEEKDEILSHADEEDKIFE